MNIKSLIIFTVLSFVYCTYAMDSQPTQNQEAYYGPSDPERNIQWIVLIGNIGHLNRNIATLSDEYVASNSQDHKNYLATKIDADIKALYTAIAEKEALELKDLREQFIYDCVMDDYRSKQR